MPSPGLSLWNAGRTDRPGVIRGRLAAILALMVTLGAIRPLPVSAREPMKVYRNHDNTANKIALTFDDGPHPRYTLEILDVLEEYGVRATFFMVGQNASYYPDAACEVARRGHEIGNHTQTHPRASRQTDDQLREELALCEETVQRLTDTSPKLFRPPEGNWDERVYRLARERDYPVILWDLDTMDWAHCPPDRIAAYVTENIKSGDIILMHDYHTGGCTTTEALRLFIPPLIEAGYCFVTVSELIGTD